MNLPTVLIGVVSILFGVYTAWARIARPEQLGKLTAMRKAYGSAGAAIHFLSYTLVPLVGGAIFLFTGLSGKSIF